MSVETLLSRLDKVRQSGKGSWTARCPAHDDKNPSLAISDKGDGMVLVHCFAQCPVESIVAAVGLDLDVLFPDKMPVDGAPLRRPFPAADVLECLSLEMTIVVTAAGNLAQGVELTEDDRKRLLLAAERIEEARRLALGER